jgi:drug/metabolite transporter (DMT)-like permease
MKARDLSALLLLAAIWGASFLFMRAAAPEFGAFALVFVRVGLASLVLLPLLFWQGQWPMLRQHWRAIAVVGLLNSALPFILFTVAALALNAGLMAIFNATTPLWTAVVAWLWLGHRPAAQRALGLAIGFGGVVFLAAGKASLLPGEHGVSPAAAIAACLGAALLYGVASNYTQKRLPGVPALALSVGSMLSATAVMALPALATWPAVTPGATAWGAAVLLAVLCSGVAYILYFGLIARLGPSGASSVTFLIPLFAVLWGALWLDERPTTAMWVGGAVILAGTALATMVRPQPR